MKVIIDESKAQRESNQAVKKWLWRYRDAKLKVTRLAMEYVELESSQWSVQAIDYDKVSVQSGVNTSDLSNLMVTKDASLTRLLKAKGEMERVFNELVDAIGALEYETERAVISLRYIQLSETCAPKEWCDIGAMLGYSEVHVQRLHGIALEKLAVIISKMR